jgi:hypothetical protein
MLFGLPDRPGLKAAGEDDGNADPGEGGGTMDNIQQ